MITITESKIWALRHYLGLTYETAICAVCPHSFSGDYDDYVVGDEGAVSIRKTVLPGMAIPMLKIRRPNGRLIFNMEIAIRR